MSNASVPPMAALPTDLKIVYTTDPVTGRLTVDFQVAPNGDLATVSGLDLLAQTVTRFMLTAVGSFPFQPAYGNPAIGLAGQATPADPATEIAGLVQIAEATFLQAQARAVAQGLLSPSETAQSFSGPRVTRGPRPGQYGLAFTVTNRAGGTTRVTVPPVG